MSVRLDLSERLDVTAAEGLLADLQAARGADVTLSGAAVRHLGAASAQILLAAAESWAREGRAFAVAPRSEALSRDLALLGLAPEDIGSEEPGPEETAAEETAAEETAAEETP